MDQSVWHNEDFQVRVKMEKPKIELTIATQTVSERV